MTGSPGPSRPAAGGSLETTPQNAAMHPPMPLHPYRDHGINRISRAKVGRLVQGTDDCRQSHSGRPHKHARSKDRFALAGLRPSKVVLLQQIRTHRAPSHARPTPRSLTFPGPHVELKPTRCRGIRRAFRTFTADRNPSRHSKLRHPSPTTTGRSVAATTTPSDGPPPHISLTPTSPR